MNTNSELDRIVQGFLEDRVAAPPRAELLRGSLARTSVTAQTRRRFLGRWLDRDEGGERDTDEDERPRARNRRNRRMLSASGITAALAILALSVNGMDFGPAPPDAGTGSIRVVTADGTGEFDTIQAAVDAAADGDTITIGPGSYVEAVVIDKDLILTGDGPREEIVVTIADDGPLLASADRPIRYAFHLYGADVSVGNLTIEGSGKRMVAVVAQGGRPTIHDVSLDFGQLTGLPRSFAFVGAGADATVRDNQANARLVIEDAIATVANNASTGPDWVNGLVVGITGASDVRIADNRLNGIDVQGGNVRVDGNELFAPDGCAVTISGRTTTVTATANTVRDSETGICAGGRASATITSNEIFGSGTGISLGSDDVNATANVVHDNGVGILFRVGSPTVAGNDVKGNRVGLAFGTLPTSPVLSGNDVCGNEANVQSVPGIEPPPIDGDQVC